MLSFTGPTAHTLHETGKMLSMKVAALQAGQLDCTAHVRVSYTDPAVGTRHREGGKSATESQKILGQSGWKGPPEILPETGSALSKRSHLNPVSNLTPNTTQPQPNPRASLLGCPRNPRGSAADTDCKEVLAMAGGVEKGAEQALGFLGCYS